VMSGLDSDVFPRKVPSPEGLPAGWYAIEKQYKSGSYAGRTYIRFEYDGPGWKARNVTTLRQAILQDAEANGYDGPEAVARFEAAQEMKKAEKKKERELSGQLEGERKEQALACFREAYGPLEAVTIGFMPGWDIDTKYLEVSGQTHVRYISPAKKTYGTVVAVEVYLGIQMLEGSREAAEVVIEGRKRVEEKYGKLEKGFNPLRRANDGVTLKQTFVTGGADAFHKAAKEKRRKVTATAHPEDYLETKSLVVAPVPFTPQGDNAAPPSDALATLRKAGADEEVAKELLQTAMSMRAILARRGFLGQVELVAIFNCDCVGNAGLVPQLCGVYYKLPEHFSGRPYYQKVSVASHFAFCMPVYIFWSSARHRWKVGCLDDNKAGLAFCTDDQPGPDQVRQPWQVLREDFPSLLS